LADYDEAIRRDPQLSLAYFHRAVLQFRRQHLDEALADLKHILDDGHDDAAALRLSARIEVQRQDLAGAVRDFEAARRITQLPGDDIDLGYALFATGECARSSAAFSAAKAAGASNKYIDREYMVVNPRGNRVVFDCNVRNDELVFFAR